MINFLYLMGVTILFSSAGQVGSDLYLPSLPAITQSFQTSVHYVQATVFCYLFGFAFSRLIYGPVSDAIGRKKPLIVGVSLFCLGSIICALAQNVWILMLGRCLQGVGAGAGVVIALAIVRDVLEGKTLAKLFSYLSISNIVLIASAPLLGGIIQHFFGWRINFVFLLIYSSIALILTLFFLPETNKSPSIEHLQFYKIKSNLYQLFSSQQYVVYSLLILLSYGSIMAWLTLGPVLLQVQLHITPIGFGWIAVAVGVVYGMGAFLNAQLLRRFSMHSMLMIGVGLQFIGGAGLLIFYLMGYVNLMVIVFPLLVFMSGGGFVFPNAFSGALIPFPKIAGLASAVLGFVQISGGVISSGLISILPDTTQLPLAVIYLLSSVVSLFLLGWLLLWGNEKKMNRELA